MGVLPHVKKTNLGGNTMQAAIGYLRSQRSGPRAQWRGNARASRNQLLPRNLQQQYPEGSGGQGHQCPRYCNPQREPQTLGTVAGLSGVRGAWAARRFQSPPEVVL
jgi:hypothetical protein